MFEIKPYLLPMRFLFSQPQVFCPEYVVFVEMNILKTFSTVSSGSWKVFWEIDVPKMSKNIEILQIGPKSFKNAQRNAFW